MGGFMNFALWMLAVIRAVGEEHNRMSLGETHEAAWSRRQAGA